MCLASQFLLPVNYCPLLPGSILNSVFVRYIFGCHLQDQGAVYCILFASSMEQIYFSPLLSVCRWDVTDNETIFLSNTSGQIDTNDRPFRQLGRGAVVSNIYSHTGLLRPPLVIAPLRTTSSSLSNLCPSRRKGRTTDRSLGRWPATITCFFSDRTVYSVPSLALRRAVLTSCASQQKGDGHHQSMEQQP